MYIRNMRERRAPHLIIQANRMKSMVSISPDTLIQSSAAIKSDAGQLTEKNQRRDQD